MDGYGTHTTVLVTGRSGGWVQVALPTRPNGTRGWVAAAGVRLRSDPWRIAVSLRHRRLVVTYAGHAVRRFPAAVGTVVNPTPRGVFYVTDVIRTTEPAYAPYALALSGFSPTLSEFGGGDGQVAIHGTDEAGSIGHRASHGCVRVHPAASRYLGRTIPAGTPVVIR